MARKHEVLYDSQRDEYAVIGKDPEDKYWFVTGWVTDSEFAFAVAETFNKNLGGVE